MNYVYRYNDHNRPGDGHAEVVLQRRVIIKETACYVWHVPEPYPWNGISGQMQESEWYFKQHKRSYNHPKKTHKDADRSAWHTTKERALKAWYTRKGYQLARLKLALERVELCRAAVVGQGMLSPGRVIHGEVIPVRIKDTPDSIVAGYHPELDNYCWQEY